MSNEDTKNKITNILADPMIRAWSLANSDETLARYDLDNILSKFIEGQSLVSFMYENKLCSEDIFQLLVILFLRHNIATDASKYLANSTDFTKVNIIASSDNTILVETKEKERATLPPKLYDQGLMKIEDGKIFVESKILNKALFTFALLSRSHDLTEEFKMSSKTLAKTRFDNISLYEDIFSRFDYKLFMELYENGYSVRKILHEQGCSPEDIISFLYFLISERQKHSLTLKEN